MNENDKKAEPVAEILQASNTQKILNWLQDWSHLPAGSKLYSHFQQGLAVNGETSDGYHTFNELYEFRKAYNAALFNEWAALGKCSVHKSWRHHDGGLCFGGGWFIVVAVLPEGQISNHYEAKDWELFNIPSTERALFEFDGHTGSDVLDRLKSYTHPTPAVAQEPVAWRPILQHPIPWVTGKPQESDIRHWTSQDCEVEYAYTHPAQPVRPAGAQEPVVFPGDALRWGLKECGVSQTDNGVHFPESALAKLAAILACAYTNRVLAQKPESVTFDNDAAWNLAQKVRTDLDRKACPGAFMDLAMESINRHYTKAPAVADFSDAYHGAREDLAIWKKRALEAEELNRKFIADINGHTFMGEPAQPVQPAGAQEEPVAEVTAKMILDQEWRIYAYKVGQLMVGTKLYAKAPTAALNEQLLEQLQRMIDFVTTGLEVKEDHPYVEMACAAIKSAREHGL